MHGITNRQWIEKGDGSLDRTARTPDNKGTLSQVNAMFLNISVLHSQFRNENVLIILQNSYNYIKVEIKFASLWFTTILLKYLSNPNYLKLYVQVSALCHFLNETFFFTRFHNYFEFMLSSRKGIKIEFKVR